MKKKAVILITMLEKVLYWIIIPLAFVLIIYHWLFSGATTGREIASFYASLATMIGVIWAIINVRRALSIRKKELIGKLYERFLEKSVYELYEKIKNQDDFELTDKNKRALNKMLTLFDEVDYFKTQKLFGDEIWEYIACELVNLSCHKKVRAFLKENRKKYPKPKNKYQEDMMPFTGFEALVNELPEDYWFRDRPNREENND